MSALELVRTVRTAHWKTVVERETDGTVRRYRVTTTSTIDARGAQSFEPTMVEAMCAVGRHIEGLSRK